MIEWITSFTAETKAMGAVMSEFGPWVAFLVFLGGVVKVCAPLVGTHYTNKMDNEVKRRAMDLKSFGEVRQERDSLKAERDQLFTENALMKAQLSVAEKCVVHDVAEILVDGTDKTTEP